MEINELIRKRFSTRAFSSQSITDEALYSLIEAARWAASARNEQPWRFIIGSNNSDYYQRIFNCLDEGNKVWAQNAPVLIITMAMKHYAFNDSLNRYALHDVSWATANLCLQATHLGLMVHPMGGFDSNRIISEFEIPEIMEPVTILAIGYAGRVEDLPVEIQNREKSPRKRNDIADLIYLNDTIK